MTPRPIQLERRRMRREGFLGRAGKVVSCHRDGNAHCIRIVKYQYIRPNGDWHLFAEMYESHDRARRARIVPLADLVHLVQNVGTEEFRQIATRRKPKK